MSAILYRTLFYHIDHDTSTHGIGKKFTICLAAAVQGYNRHFKSVS